MSKVAMVALYILRLAGLGALALGLLFWSGYLPQLQREHMALGVLVVLSLWTLAGYGLGRKELRAWSVGLLALGLVVAALGATQVGLLPGDAHWMVRLVHLLLGLGAMAQGERIARRLRVGSQQVATGALSPPVPR